MIFETFKKANIAVAKVINDLTNKEYDILTPLSEQLPFDVVAHKDGKFYRLQVKYCARRKRGDGHFVKRLNYIWYKKTSRDYKEEDFDYFALYLPEVDRVVYPSIKLRGITIRSDAPKNNQSIYVYTDFLNFTDEAVKRKF